MAWRPQPGDREGAAEAYRTLEAVHRYSWPFMVGLLTATVAFGGLALLASTVLYFPIDLTISREVQALPAPWLAIFAAAVSWIGFPPQSNGIFGLIIVGMFLAGRRWEAGMALFAAAGSAGLWFLIAPLVHRPRPSPDLIHVAAPIGWGSFPSGHVLNLTAFFGFLCFLAYTLLRPWLPRALCLIVCGGLVLLIGPARIYSGEHWPTDVLGGYMLGGIWLAITIHLYHWGTHRASEQYRPPPLGPTRSNRSSPRPS